MSIFLGDPPAPRIQNEGSPWYLEAPQNRKTNTKLPWILRIRPVQNVLAAYDANKVTFWLLVAIVIATLLAFDLENRRLLEFLKDPTRLLPD